MTALLIVAACGAAALAFAFVKSGWINQQDGGTDKMKEIGGHIAEGAMAFLAREYKVLSGFVVVVAGLLVAAYSSNASSHWLIAVAFICGAFASGLAGFFGMRVATAANFRTTAAARDGLVKALNVSFAGGAVMGMSVVGLALVGLTVLWMLFKGQFETARALNVLTGFSFGASSIALFARVGGGIYTKAADVGADLVGKVEAGIPEDDPRNPATIADNVGDNVGDVAGMGADLFESYVGAILGSMVLGWTYAQYGGGLDGDWGILVELPLYIAAMGIICSIIGTFLVKTVEGGDPHKALHKGTFAAAALVIAGTYGLASWLVPDTVKNLGGPQGAQISGVMGIWLSVVGGLAAGTLIGLVTEYYTSDHKAPVHGIAKQAETGSATVIIAGLGVGMASTTIPVLLLAGTVVGAYYVAGLYGVGIAALGMLSTTGIQLAVDAYGPIADNAGGIAEMSDLPPEVRERTDKLDAVGNTTAAIGKGFAIGSAALTALALFASFAANAKIAAIDVMNPKTMAGVFIGAMLPYLFSSMAMGAVGRAAFAMIEEVRRQFREIPGLLKGEAVADYRRCVDISTASAIKEMVAPGLLAISAPIIVGFWDKYALGGMLVGVTASGVLLALFMSNAGGAWDNAKKYIEGGHHGGKGSEAHKAAVVGDTVGDPFKDTAGPALNILIKLMSVLALVLAPSLADQGSKKEDTSAALELPAPIERTVQKSETEPEARPASLALLKTVDE